MTEIKTVQATLSIKIDVECPWCNELIDLLDEKETNDFNHDEESALLEQIFPEYGDRTDFMCDDVTCSKCKTTFNVRKLDW